MLDGGALVNWLVSLALHTPDLVQVPNWIGEMAVGRPQAVAIGRASSVAPPGFVGYGLTYGVTCSEWLPYERPSAVLERGHQAFPSYPTSVLVQPPQIPFINADCRAWNVPKAPVAQRAVTRSRIPTLLLSGGFDPVAPRRWARIAARTLRNSTSVTIPGVGHFVLPESPCAQRVAASFLATPRTPNTGCVAHLKPPPFAAATGT